MSNEEDREKRIHLSKKQQQNKISGSTAKSRETTAHIQKVKKLRKNVCSFQDTDNPPDSDPNQPGPSGQGTKK